MSLVADIPWTAHQLYQLAETVASHIKHDNITTQQYDCQLLCVQRLFFDKQSVTIAIWPRYLS
jgi:hypothetical protein